MVVDLNTNVAMNFINFTDLLTALPKIQQITSMRYHNANWITEILQVKHHLLTVLTLRYEHFEQCDEFDKNQLLTFLKAQRTGFRLTLDIREANVEFVAQLMEFLDKNLDRDYDPDKADYYFRNEVAITNGTETIGRWCLPPDENEMHFLVKSKPLVKFSLAKTNEEAEYEVVDGEII
uniref:FTH domain-containing protein n=1 Tax=Panagrellus redivivus TaxID=6233 RepID=A0A7E4V8N0_PANRE